MTDDFILMTDDNSDLPEEFYERNGVAVLRMNYIIDGVTYYAGDRTVEEFYQLLRLGKTSTTAAANSEEIKAVMETHVAQGKDLLYLAFSSGLSATSHNAEMTARELSEKYPGRKIIVVDSLCASMGQALFVYMANRKKQAGASIDEVAQWARDNRLKVVHLVIADDLMYLHRGGRVSRTSAIAGSMLGIKPIIHVNNEGKLIAIDKARGKKQAVANVLDRFQACMGETKPDHFMISHADCIEDAEYAAEQLSERFGIRDYTINFIGPVIGTHAGPGTIALFMMAEHR